ncbi:Hypothetical predicted protein [Marmota monax]|uniref:Uncharacterized protein n=1 Tax=Marmota monax TaxID=9995 RepID=A0A5E4AXK6_MARMO|nr:hypothetical protein GHT09_002236 [Marmota monax]VTJ61560.1 Hypothetical predicted protein [Marmota monax]
MDTAVNDCHVSGGTGSLTSLQHRAPGNGSSSREPATQRQTAKKTLPGTQHQASSQLGTLPNACGHLCNLKLSVVRRVHTPGACGSAVDRMKAHILKW